MFIDILVLIENPVYSEVATPEGEVASREIVSFFRRERFLTVESI